jgi:hypothetical protein
MPTVKRRQAAFPTQLNRTVCFFEHQRMLQIVPAFAELEHHE